jgi:hypothetical protein
MSVLITDQAPPPPTHPLRARTDTRRKVHTQQITHIMRVASRDLNYVLSDVNVNETNKFDLFDTRN